MNAQAANAPRVDEAAGTVTYEQPLAERMRTFLRMEFLAQQANHHSLQASTWSSRAAIGSLLEILTILGRGDIRGEVLKELERQAAQLAPYVSRPGVDKPRLETLLERVSDLRAQLADVGAHYAQPLKESEFLSAIKHRSAIPGGTCEFDLPDFKHWLSLPYEQRVGDFQLWFRAIKPLCDSVAQVLWLTRESAQGQPQVARHGLFQHALERGTPAQLLRVTMPAPCEVYPEISGSQHRFTIRFLNWVGIGERPVQTGDDISFVLACC
ncbi:MAG: cell division protein ZapD [Gammaproteobacteria bacterium]|jgi:cell division protein ZapD|nr:MAG: cell division protein ZapD [Gammaproteobacteria bacterium]